MNKPMIGVVVGGILGLLDGLSAWAYPEARPMMAAIVTGSVVKGILTGLATGLVARWRRSTTLGIAGGATVGAVLSMLAAAGQPDHYWAIVLPGMILGVVVGYATQRYGSPRAAGVPPIATLAFAVVAASSVALGAQAPASAPAPANDLSSLSFFLGRWEGTTEGQPGRGTATREYTSELRSRVIEAKNRSVYPAQPANPKGEVHEDLGIYSYDRAAKRVRFRQFHVEGFVIHYVQEPDTKRDTWIYASETIENIPKGYRSRETHVRLGPDEFEEVFELADPEKDFEVYSRTRFKRVR